MKPGHMKPENENQKVTVCFLKTVTSWAKRTSWSRMRQRLEQGLLNWIRSSRIYMAVQMLIYRNSASCWPQIQLENGSRLISALMQNCWAVQDCRTHFISQLCTRGVGPDSRTPGLKRTRCPSEIRSFSYLVWFTDQARKVLIFCKQVICASFPYRMLSDQLAQKETAGASLFSGSPQPSAVTFQLDWLKYKAMKPIDLWEIIFVCLFVFCVWPFGFSSRVKSTGMRHSASHKVFL